MKLLLYRLPNILAPSHSSEPGCQDYNATQTLFNIVLMHIPSNHDLPDVCNKSGGGDASPKVAMAVFLAPYAVCPPLWTIFTRELCSWTHFSLAEILVLVGGAIPPAPAVPASTRISAKLR